MKETDQLCYEYFELSFDGMKVALLMFVLGTLKIAKLNIIIIDFYFRYESKSLIK